MKKKNVNEFILAGRVNYCAIASVAKHLSKHGLDISSKSKLVREMTRVFAMSVPGFENSADAVRYLQSLGLVDSTDVDDTNHKSAIIALQEDKSETTDVSFTEALRYKGRAYE